MAQEGLHHTPEFSSDVASTSATAGMDCRILFAQRRPSQTWEVVTLPTNPPLELWAWFKPVQAPSAIMLQVSSTVAPHPTGFSLRQILRSLGIEPTAVPMCSLFGFWFPGDGGTSPHLDQIVTGPAPGGDPNIVIYVDVPQQPAAPVPASRSKQPIDGQTREVFRSFERDWKTTRNLERQLIGLQKQLVDMQSRLNTMNRDLTGDEALYAERSDLEDWREARRFLRDAASRLSKCIKELVAGETTYVGKRQWFEQIYNEFVTTQTAFTGMKEARDEFEYYRRTIQNLCDRMQAAYHHAQHEGINKAQVVLSRISMKVASQKAKGR